VSKKRERSNRKHGRTVSRFGPLTLRLRHTTWRISTIIDSARSLGAAVPKSSRKNSQTRQSLTHSRNNNNTREPTSSSRQQPPTPQIQGRTLGDQLLNHKKNSSHRQGTYKIDLAMKDSSLCEKTR